MPLPTATQIRNMGLKGLEGPGADTRITNLIAAADKLFARWCLFPAEGGAEESTMDEHNFIEYYDGPDRDDPSVLRLKLRPLVEITTIQQDPNGDWTYSETVPLSDYAASNPTGVLTLKPTSTYSWQRSKRGIKVTGTFGFQVDQNELLTLAIALQVAHWWTMPGGMAPQVTNLSQGGQAVTVSPLGLPCEPARHILQMYKLTEREYDYEP